MKRVANGGTRLRGIAITLAILTISAGMLFAAPAYADSVELSVMYSCYTQALELTLEEFSASNREFQWVPQEYYLYDVDGNGITELIVKAGTCEADYVFRICTIENNQIVFLGEVGGGHSMLFSCAEGGFYILYGHMGYEAISRVTYNNGLLSEELLSQRELGPDDDYATPGGIINCTTINDFTLLRDVCFGADNPDAPAVYGIVNRNKVNIRTAPDRNQDNALGWLNKGDRVIILDNTYGLRDTWYHVMTEGRVTGYEKAGVGVEGYIIQGYVDVQ